MLYEVLHQRPKRPSWLVGETKAERVERMRSDDAPSSDRWYPGSYPRRVVSIRAAADVESGKLPTLSNMAGDMLGVRVLDLTDDERQGAASKTMKVKGGALVPVTFDDRFGAVAVKLRERHADPEQWERDERTRVETEEEENEKRREDYDRAREEYGVLKADFPRELHEWSMSNPSEVSGEFMAVNDSFPPAFPERPKAPRIIEVYQSSFDREAMALAKSLAPTVTHTGTGLYCVKKTPTKHDDVITNVPIVDGKVYLGLRGLGWSNAYIGGYTVNVTRSELRAIISHGDNYVVLDGDLSSWQQYDVLEIYDAWSTIQAANDQLETDQGSAEFASEQELCLFDGTYSEAVTSTLLRPSVKARFAVRAASGQTAVVHSNSGTGAVHWTLSTVMRGNKIFEGFTLLGDDVASDMFVGIREQTLRLVNMVLDGQSNIVRAWASFSIHTQGCTFRDFTQHAVQTSNGCEHDNALFENCVSYETSLSPNTFHGCTFDRTFIRVASSAGSPQPILRNQFYNCTFYNVTSVFDSTGDDGLNVITMNCIFDNCTTVYDGGSAGSMDLQADYNTFNGVTNFAIVAGAATTTLAAWQATADYNGNFPDVNSIEADPLLTAPGSGDFSLQTTSPCKWTGRGSGVLTGSNGVAFDPAHPDRGAWSSGIVPAPSWTADTSNIAATDLAATGEVGLTCDVPTATVLTNLSKGYIWESRVGAGAYVEHGRSITNSFTVGNLTDGVEREFRVAAYTRVAAEPSSVASDTDTATPTGVAIPDVPAITATDLLNQSDVQVDIVAGNPGDESTIYYQIIPGGVLLTWGNTVTGDGSETLTGLLVQPYVIYAVAERGGCKSDPSNLVFLTIQAADQYTNIRTALYEWIKGVVGNPSVIWREPNAPQPARQYVSIKMNPTVTVGSDYHSGADANGVETVEGNREFVFSIQVHGKPANEDGSATISINERIRSSLQKRSIQATLSAAGLSFVDVAGKGDLSGIGGTQYEARSFMDIRFRTTYSDDDDVGYIGTVVDPVGTLEQEE